MANYSGNNFGNNLHLIKFSIKFILSAQGNLYLVSLIVGKGNLVIIFFKGFRFNKFKKLEKFLKEVCSKALAELDLD